jgi:hypothetical protein
MKEVFKTDVGNKMSKILADFDNEDPEEEIRMKGKYLLM